MRNPPVLEAPTVLHDEQKDANTASENPCKSLLHRRYCDIGSMSGGPPCQRLQASPPCLAENQRPAPLRDRTITERRRGFE
jgi:hypothetical protein